jgi:hypothetical protein
MCNAPALTARHPVALAGILLSLCAAGASAGSLDAPAAPSSASSAFYTLEDIYHRLTNNTQATKRTGGFTEPSAAPAPTGQTLDEVYAQAIPTQVPKTGQTFWYYVTDSDGALQKGVPSPSPRFTDNNNGTVTDNLTGLIWLKNANCQSTNESWSDELSLVASLNSAGTMNGYDCGDTSHAGSHQTDWRLPNIKELQSLVDFGENNPALPSGYPFSNVQVDRYWSSTTREKDPSYAWVVYMDYGTVSYKRKSWDSYGWPVRGGH